jgi:1-acyl-sn-glycerol-3-phosphate acyltransferase
LFYRLLKVFVRLAMLIFCRKIIINKPELLKSKGPLLLACNHPNSFLDSVIINTLFQQPVWSLARGDVFKKPFYIRLLTAMKILPVYRTSEGVENLNENYKTFDACIDIFKKDGLVLIYSEGKCINEWHLRPLKKGTARLAFKSWEEKIPLQVLPVGINYSSFHRFGKNMFINFGDTISIEDINMNEADGIRHQTFNNKLKEELEKLVFEIPKTDKQQQEEKLKLEPSLLVKIILAVPAFIGWIVHLPLFFPIKNFTWKRTAHNDHYDSVMMGILFVSYPFYLLLLTTLICILLKSWWGLLLLVVLPFTAWSYVQLKPQIDK